jgi:TonB family protein
MSWRVEASPRRRPSLGPFLLGSALLHAVGAGLLSLVPLHAEIQRPEEFTEITLLPQPEAGAALEPEPAVATVPGTGWDPEPASRGGGGAGGSYVPADLPAILGRAQQIRRRASAGGPEVDIELPVSSAPVASLDLTPYKLPLVPASEAPATDLAAAGQGLGGEPSVMKEVSSERPERQSLERPVDFRSLESALQGARGAGAAGGLQGPAAERLLLEQPPAPDVEVSEDTLLRFRFWVLPDGRVGEVVPLQKGNAELERHMAEYLRRWRFNALPPGGAKVWGEITIKFRPT